MPKNQTTQEDLASGMRTVIGRINRGLRQAGGHTDFSPSQLEVFGTIARRGDLRMSELAEREGINPTLLSRIVAKLEEAGLVTRTPDPDDRRVWHVSPTDHGRSLYVQIRDERTDTLDMAIAELSPSERKALAAALPALETLSQTLKNRTL